MVAYARKMAPVARAFKPGVAKKAAAALAKKLAKKRTSQNLQRPKKQAGKIAESDEAAALAAAGDLSGRGDAPGHDSEDSQGGGMQGGSRPLDLSGIALGKGEHGGTGTGGGPGGDDRDGGGSGGDDRDGGGPGGDDRDGGGSGDDDRGRDMSPDGDDRDGLGDYRAGDGNIPPGQEERVSPTPEERGRSGKGKGKAKADNKAIGKVIANKHKELLASIRSKPKAAPAGRGRGRGGGRGGTRGGGTSAAGNRAASMPNGSVGGGKRKQGRQSEGKAARAKDLYNYKT